MIVYYAKHEEYVDLYKKIHTEEFIKQFTPKELAILEFALARAGLDHEMAYDRDENFFCHASQKTKILG